ncbi:regulator of microtubule dynamics protein 1 isoform X3 [Podarcis muralis]
MASVARLLRRGGCAVRTRLLWEAPKARLGWRRQVASGRGGGGSEVLEQSRFFRRGVAFSALSYLGYEAYILISHSSVVHADVKVNEVLDQADYLYGSGETEKLYQLLEQYKNSENAQLLWRLARASRDVAQLSQTSAEKKKQLIYEALDYATKALEKEKSCFSVHKWYAICLSDVGDYEGIKKKITNAFVIKEHFQKAIELNPKDATSLHLMGIWCYTFADMPWYQSKIAAALFSTPPSSTYEEALRYFQKAEDVEPNFYSKNLLFLGKTYMKLNNRKMALFWLSKAKERLSHTEEDKQNELLLPCCQKRRSLNQENERSRQR